MPISADLLLDTSAAVALIQKQHERHAQVTTAARGKRLGLAGHALIETYSVLTRLPGAARVSPARAAEVIRHDFPHSHALSARTAARVVDLLEEAGVSGGSVYDGLVALAAREAAVPLLTCDHRATTTYARLGVQTVLA